MWKNCTIPTSNLTAINNRHPNDGSTGPASRQLSMVVFWSPINRQLVTVAAVDQQNNNRKLGQQPEKQRATNQVKNEGISTKLWQEELRVGENGSVCNGHRQWLKTMPSFRGDKLLMDGWIRATTTPHASIEDALIQVFIYTHGRIRWGARITGPLC